MNRRTIAALLLAALPLTLATTACTDPQTQCEKGGGTWLQQWHPAYGGYPGRWEYRCVYPFRPLSPPSYATGIAGPGVVDLKWTDHGDYIKVRQDDGQRVVQKVPADVYRRCHEGARWPDCAH
jgi:hypothetical protein